MSKLKKILRKKKYKKVKLKMMKTNHLELSAKINGKKGRFILDTGASNTCIGLDLATYFNVQAEESDIKAAGTGTIDMQTHISDKNKLKIGKWKTKTSFILIDLTNVNTALAHQDEDEVHGIIGADILDTAKAIIDYDKKVLFLKK